MAITKLDIVVGGVPAIMLIIEGDSIEKHRELVQRGANLWPDAHYSIKEFADIITTGKKQQDYKAQSFKS